MRKYVLSRLLQLIPILLGITLLSFTMMWLAGGDAVTMTLENQGVAVSAETERQMRAQLGLDRPFLVQYGSWLLGVLTGDMGASYVSGKDVFQTFVSKLPATAVLAGSSLLVTVLLSVPLGLYTAVRQNRASDYIVRACCFVGNSMPNFFVALLLLLAFAVRLVWLPVISSGVARVPGQAQQLLGPGLVLPTATLAISMTAKYTRQVRAAVLDELAKPYVDGARSRGVRERALLIRDVLRSCLVMVVTLVALSLGDLLGGTAIVETIFQYDGVGKMAVDAITMRDYPVILAYVVWMAIIYVAVNLVADLLYRRLDPRVRLGEEGGA